MVGCGSALNVSQQSRSPKPNTAANNYFGIRSRDPIGYAGGWNLYEYVRSRPINLTDPSGNNPCKCGRRRPTWMGCCNKQPYRKSTQCCQNGTIVAKVTYWVCNRPLGGYPSWFPHHKYVCCGGPNQNCYAHRDNDIEQGDPIPTEPNPTGDCEARLVCPETKRLKCNNPVAPRDGNTCLWNCRDWAECDCDDYPPDMRD
jgi:hypothetical protein